MNAKDTTGFAFLLMLCSIIKALDSDSLAYPELMNALYVDILRDDSQTKMSFVLNDELYFKTKSHFSYRGFNIQYRNEGGCDQEIQQRVSLNYSHNGIFFGWGYGQPHIAKGFILGNTMMRFSPELSGQAGIRSPKMKIAAYEQYKSLIGLSFPVGTAHLAAFRYDTSYGAFIHGRFKDVSVGFACHAAEKIVTEIWIEYIHKQLKTSVNYSMSRLKFNHAAFDIYYRLSQLQVYMAGVYLAPGFDTVKPDSKWGSGLVAGSRGLAGGLISKTVPWKFSGMAYGMFGELLKEEKCIFEMAYKKHPFDITIAYTHKQQWRLSESEIFPFKTIWEKETENIIKLNIKIKMNSYYNLVSQLQVALMDKRSYVSLLRLNYKKGRDNLKFQLTRCCGFETDLYFIRPAGGTYYGIRKAADRESLYMDLVYTRTIEKCKIFVHLRNEGVSLGLEY